MLIAERGGLSDCRVEKLGYAEQAEAMRAFMVSVCPEAELKVLAVLSVLRASDQGVIVSDC